MISIAPDRNGVQERSSDVWSYISPARLNIWLKSYLYRTTTQQVEAALQIRSLIKTKTPKIEYREYSARTESQLCRFFQIVRAYLDDLDRGRFVHRPGLGCTMCDFSDGTCDET